MSLPVCRSIAGVPLRQSDTTASVQHRSWCCNALWDVVTIHLSLPLYLMFPALAIAPSAWQRPYHKCCHGWKRTIVAQRQVAMTTAIYLICIFCLYYGLMPNMVNLIFRSLPCTSSFTPFLQQCALAVYTDINAFFCMQDVNEKRKRLCQWDQFGSWTISGKTAS